MPKQGLIDEREHNVFFYVVNLGLENCLQYITKEFRSFKENAAKFLHNFTILIMKVYTMYWASTDALIQRL